MPKRREDRKNEVVFINPKTGINRDPVDAWYRYYAGYSAAFVEKAIQDLAPRASTVLDPWNGTGTTTVVAACKGMTGIGFDLNPALVVVSRARLLGSGVWASIAPLSDDLVAHANSVISENEALRFWFSAEAAAVLRGLQISVNRLLIDSGSLVRTPSEAVPGMSTLAAFFYTVLFRTVRVLIAPAAGSNPTWWKKLPECEQLNPSRQTIVNVFNLAAVELSEGLHRENFDEINDTRVDIGDCRKISMGDNSIDIVVSSPPYCTRIDYGVATRPELAVLGVQDPSIKELRDGMVGTPTITKTPGAPEIWGERAQDFLAAVEAHTSKASSGYYLKYFRQYYASMWTSLAELRRVTRPDSPVVLVVQDNFYKDIHNDTPGILSDFALLQGFNSVERHDFQSLRNRATMNPRARVYRSVTTATESVLVFH